MLPDQRLCSTFQDEFFPIGVVMESDESHVSRYLGVRQSSTDFDVVPTRLLA